MQNLASLTLLSFVLLAIGLPAEAQDYPTRPVTILVPYAAGGGSDQLVRLIARRLEARLGKPFIIENRLGGGTVVGATAGSRATPDGYTLMIGSSTPMAINVSLHKNLPYDPVADFAPIALIAEVPFFLVVNPKLPIHSVSDLVALAKSKAGDLTIASSGFGTAAHLYAELLMSSLDIKMTHIPYKGGSESIKDVLGGHVSMVFTELTSGLPSMRGGQVRPIGVSTARRVAAMPDVPPLAEAGVPGYDAAAWQMIVAPAKTPKEIIDKLHQELRTIIAEPTVNEEIMARGATPIISPPPAELSTFIKFEISRWAKIVQQAGIERSQ